MPSPLCGVWNEQALAASSEVILCEALLDAMTFWCAGYRNVIAAYEVNGFTASHLAALQYHGVKRVLIAFDRDEAGDRGAEAVAEQLAGCGIEARQVRFPAGLDANAYAVKSGNAEHALGLALEQSVRMNSGAVVAPEIVAASGETTPPQKYVDILSPEAKQHILYGDSPTQGGHLYPGNPGKTVFPQSWSADKVVHTVGDIATSPDTKWFAQTGTGGTYTNAGRAA